MNDGAMVQVNADKIANFTKFKAEEIAIIKNTVAKGTTDLELAYFLSVCSSVNLNPMMKEVWCYKDNRGNLLIFAGRDGFLKRAQESGLWNGMTSAEVYAEDFFEMDVAKAIVTHRPNFKERKTIIGAYAIVRPKGCEFVTVEWADFKTYDKGQFVWKQFPGEMIKKTAEVHALKKAFGITALQSEYDFQIKESVAVPVTEIVEGNVTRKKIIDALDLYVGEDREEIKAMCVEKGNAGEFNDAFAQSVAEKIGLEL